MDHVFGAHMFSDRQPDQNMLQMNSLFMNLISTSSFCDCQSHPLKEYFGDFYTKARYSVEATYERIASTAPIELRPTRVFERFIEQNVYTDVIQYRAEVPEGLVVSYLDYLEVLAPAQERANQVIDAVIEPFTKFVAKLISDPIFRNQIGHEIKEFRGLEAGYEKTLISIAKCFGKNDFHASAGFGEVVKRNSDWKTVFSQTANLKKLYQAFPSKEIASKLNRLYEQLDVLIEQVKTDQFDSVEKEVTQILSKGMYHIAKEIEQASLTTFRSKTFIECINTTILNIDAIADRQKK